MTIPAYTRGESSKDSDWAAKVTPVSSVAAVVVVAAAIAVVVDTCAVDQNESFYLR